MGGYSATCPRCGKWFINRGGLQDHVKSHNDPELYNKWLATSSTRVGDQPLEPKEPNT